MFENKGFTLHQKRILTYLLSTCCQSISDLVKVLTQVNILQRIRLTRFKKYFRTQLLQNPSLLAIVVQTPDL